MERGFELLHGSDGRLLYMYGSSGRASTHLWPRCHEGRLVFDENSPKSLIKNDFYAINKLKMMKNLGSGSSKARYIRDDMPNQ